MTNKPSEKEQEYFVQMELQRLRQLREEHQQRLAVEERARLKELHFLHCAKCGQKMSTTPLGGVEVEVCPDCGGIFLDAGELDRVLAEQNRGPFAGALSTLRRLWGDEKAKA